MKNYTRIPLLRLFSLFVLIGTLGSCIKNEPSEIIDEIRNEAWKAKQMRQASEYMTEYNKALEKVIWLNGELLSKQNDLSTAEIVYQGSLILPIDFQKDQLNKDLTKLNEELVLLQEQLKTYNDVNIGGTTVTDALEAANTEKELLIEEKTKLLVEISQKEKLKDDAQNILNNAISLINDFESNEQNIITSNANIETYTNTKAYNQVKLNEYTYLYNELLIVVTKTENEYNTAKSKYELALNTLNQLSAKKNSALEAKNLATTLYNADPTNTALYSAKVAADLAYTNALDAYNTYNSVTYSPLYSEYTTLHNLFVTQSNELDGYQNYINTYKENIENNIKNIDTEKAKIEGYNIYKSENQSTYDTAKANLGDYQKDYYTALTNYNLANDTKSILDSKIAANQSLIDNLNNDFSNFEYVIENLENQIETKIKSIADKELEIKNLDATKVNMQAIIDSLTAEIASLTEQIAKNQSLADQYKALYDELIASMGGTTGDSDTNS